MTQTKASRVVCINNPHGLHMRPITALSRRAKDFQAEVTITKDHNRVNVQHIIEMMTLAVEKGSQLLLEAVGPDAEAALAAIAEIIEHDFSKYDEENIVRTESPPADAPLS
jgi:phosphotransferase system HPr (HPr) family protein